MALELSEFLPAPQETNSSDPTTSSGSTVGSLDSVTTGYLTSRDWVQASPEERKQLAGRAAMATMDDLAKDRKLMVAGKVKDEDGNEQDGQVRAYDDKGNLTAAGSKMQLQVRGLFQQYAADETGGVYLNDVTGKYEPTVSPTQLLDAQEEMNKQHEVGPFADMDKFLKDFKDNRIHDDALPDDKLLPDVPLDPNFKGEDGIMRHASWDEIQAQRNKSKTPTYKDFVDWKNSKMEADSPAHLDADNEQMKNQFDSYQKSLSYDSNSIPEGQALDVVEGQVRFNPNMINRVDDVEKAIAALDPKQFDAMDRRIVGQQYKDILNEHAKTIADQFWASDSGYTGLGREVIARGIFGAESHDLRSQLTKWQKDGGTGYDFIKENKDRVNQDSYGMGSTFKNSLINNVLQGGGLVTPGAYLFAFAGSVIDKIAGEQTKFGKFLKLPSMMFSEFRDLQKKGETVGNFKVPIFGWNASTSEIADLAGMVGSFSAIGIGGKVMGAYDAWQVSNATIAQSLSKAAVKAETTVSKLEPALASAARLEAVTKINNANTVIEDALKAKLLARSKMSGLGRFGHDMITDFSAHIAASQMGAAGMYSGYQEHLAKNPGDVEGAAKAGDARGMSDYFAALIAGAVMHRMAPGMVRGLTGDTSSTSGSLIQRWKGAIADREGMELVRKGIGQLSENQPMIDDIMETLRDRSSTYMKSVGLKGFGAAADVASTGIEMTMMPAMADMFNWMQDDSKRWEDTDVWKNVSDNWGAYMRSGVIGALMGAAGSAMGTLHGATLGRAKNAENIRENVTLKWKALSEGIEAFKKNPELAAAFVNNEPLGMSALLSAETKMPNSEKVELFITAARLKGLKALKNLQENKPSTDPNAPINTNAQNTTTPDPETSGTASAAKGGVESASVKTPLTEAEIDAKIKGGNLITMNGEEVHRKINGEEIHQVGKTYDEVHAEVAADLQKEHLASQEPAPQQSNVTKDDGEPSPKVTTNSTIYDTHNPQDKLTFYERTHKYIAQASGKVLQSITSIIQGGKKSSSNKFSEGGTKAHLEITNALMGRGESTKYKDVVNGIRNLPDRMPAGDIVCEVPMFHKPTTLFQDGFAGTPDVFVRLTDGSKGEQRWHLVELKGKQDKNHPHELVGPYYNKGKDGLSPHDQYCLQLRAQTDMASEHGMNVVSASVFSYDAEGSVHKSKTGETHLYAKTTDGHWPPKIESLYERMFGKTLTDQEISEASKKESPSKDENNNEPPKPDGKNQENSTDSKTSNGQGQGEVLDKSKPSSGEAPATDLTDEEVAQGESDVVNVVSPEEIKTRFPITPTNERLIELAKEMRVPVEKGFDPKELTKQIIIAEREYALRLGFDKDHVVTYVDEVRIQTANALIKAGFKFGNGKFSDRADLIFRIASKVLHARTDGRSAEFSREAAKALSYVMHEELGIPERYGKTRSEIEKVLKGWLETGDVAKIDQPFLAKVTDVLQRIHAFFTGKEFTSLDERLKVEMDKIYSGEADYSYKPKEGYERIKFQDQIDENHQAADILGKLSDRGEDYTLTGSMAYADQTSIFRKKGSAIHDLDILVKNTADARANLELDHNVQDLYKVNPRNADATSVTGLIVLPKGLHAENIVSKMVGSKIGLLKTVLGRKGMTSPERSYDVVNENGEKVGNYSFKNGEEISNNAGTIVDLMEVRSELERDSYAQNYVDSDGNKRVMRVSDYVTGFVNKLQLLRYKDLHDFKGSEATLKGFEKLPPMSGLKPSETEPTDGTPKPPTRGTLNVTPEYKKLLNRKFVKPFIDRILADGIDIRLLDNEEEVGMTPESFNRMIGGTFGYRSGQRMIGLHAHKADNHNIYELVETLVHEVTHIKEADFSRTNKGKSLYEAAKKEVLGDEYIETVMRAEYPHYAELKDTLKFAEIFRAFSEGKLLGYTSAGVDGFGQYIKSFLGYMDKKFSGDSAFNQYFEGTRADLEHVIGDAKDYVGHIDYVIQKSIPEADIRAVAKELYPDGGGTWTPEVSKKFSEHLADWVAGARSMSQAIADMCAKTWKAMKVAGLAGIAMFTMNDMKPVDLHGAERTRDKMEQVADSHLQPDLGKELRAPSEKVKFKLADDDFGDVVVKSDSNALASASDDGKLGAIDTSNVQSVKVDMGKEPTVDRPVLPKVPKDVEAKMTTMAKLAYQQIYHSIKDKLISTNKLLVITDKPGAHVFIFNPDGTTLLDTKVLVGRATGDYYTGDTDKLKNRITPAGMFTLGLRDAKRGGGEETTAGHYDFGKVFVLDKAIDGAYSVTLFHSVWTHESDASKRLAALKNNDPKDSRYSFGCINLPKETFKKLLDKHQEQMDGATMFVVPDNGALLDEFLHGDTANNKSGKDDLTRQSVPKIDEGTMPTPTGIDTASNDSLPIDGLYSPLSQRRNSRKQKKRERDKEIPATIKDKDIRSINTPIEVKSPEVKPLEPKIAKRGTDNIREFDYEPITDASIYIKNEDIVNGSDSNGGTWKSHDSGEYTYRIDKDKILELGVNSVLQITGKDNAGKLFILDKIEKDVDGGTNYTFRKIDFAKAYDFNRNEWGSLNDRNSNWYRNTLASVAGAIQNNMDDMLKGRTLTEDGARKIFNQVLQHIAPHLVDEYIETPKAEMLQNSFANTSYEDGRSVMRVNFENMANRLNYVFGTVKVESTETGRTQFNKNLLAMEMARVMTRYASEEAIHSIVRMDSKDLGSFMDSSVKLFGDDRFGALKQMFSDTVTNRHPDFAPTRDSVTYKRGEFTQEHWDKIATDPAVVASVVHEVIRQLIQMRNEGTTTEATESMARLMTGDIKEDLGGTMGGGKGFVAAARTLGRLIRKYMQQIRNVMTEAYLRGNLPDEMRDRLNQINADFRRLDMQSDVDMVKNNVHEDRKHVRDIFRNLGNERIKEVAIKHTQALQALRDAGRNYQAFGKANQRVEDMVELDFDTMKMKLRPEIADDLRANHPDVDVASIETALSKLNAVGALSDVAGQMIHNRHVFESARELLGPNLSELFTNPDPLKWNDKTLKTWAMVKHMNNLNGKHSMLHDVEKSIQTTYDKVQRLVGMMDSDAVRRFGNLDITKDDGYVTALSVSEKFKFNPPTKEEIANPEALSMWHSRAMAQMDALARETNGSAYDAFPISSSDFTSRNHEGTLKELRDQIDGFNMQREAIKADFVPFKKAISDYKSSNLARDRQSVGFELGADGHDTWKQLQKRMADFEETFPLDQLGAYTVTPNTGSKLGMDIVKNHNGSHQLEYINELHKQHMKDRIRMIEADIEENAPAYNEQMRQIVGQYDNYAQAISDFNDSVKYATRIALGDTKLDTRDFAQQWYDLTGVTNQLSKDILENKKIIADGYRKDNENLTKIESLELDAKLASQEAEVGRIKNGEFAAFDKLIDSNGNLDNVFGYMIGDIDTPNTFEDPEIAAVVKKSLDNNAAFMGREHYVRFHALRSFGEMPVDDSTQDYSELGGFAASRKYNLETRRFSYPSPEEIFPNMKGADDLTSFYYKLVPFFKDANGNDFKKGFDFKAKQKIILDNFVSLFGGNVEHLTQIESLNKWIDSIEKSISDESSVYPEHEDGEEPRTGTETYDSGLRMSLPNGSETLAAGPARLLHKRIGEIREVLAAYEQHYTDSKSGLSDLVNAKRFLNETKKMAEWEASIPQDFALKPKEPEDYVRTGKSFSLEEAFQLMGFGDNTDGLKQVVLSLKMMERDVKLSRTALRNFRNDDIRRNTDTELTRTIRDVGFVPTHDEFIRGRDLPIDPVVVNNLRFALSYFDKSPIFAIGAVWAQDLHSELSRAMWGNEEKEFLGQETFPSKSNVTQVRAGLQKYGRTATLVGRRSELGEDRRFGIQGTAGNQPIDFTDIQNQSAAKNLKDVDTPRQILNRTISKAAMLIGSLNGDGKLGEQFLYDLVHYADNSRKSSDVGSEHQVTMSQLLNHAIQGLFGMRNESDLVKRMETNAKVSHWREEFLSENPQYSTRPGDLTAEGFLYDLVEFKMKKEQAEITRQRLNAVPSIRDTFTTIENALEQSTQKGRQGKGTDMKPKQLKMLQDMMHKNLNSADEPFMMFDAQALRNSDFEMHYVSSNPFVAMHLQGLGPKTMVYVANDRVLRLGDPNLHARLTIIPGQKQADGTFSPNVVFMTDRPQDNGGQTSQKDVQRVMEHYYMTLSQTNPKVREHLRDFADKVRAAINLPYVIENEGGAYWNMVKQWKLNNPIIEIKRNQIRAMALKNASDRGLDKNQASALADRAGKEFTKMMNDFLVKMSKITRTLNGGANARENAAYAIDHDLRENGEVDPVDAVVAHPETKNYMEFHPEGKDDVSNAILAAQILSNPDMMGVLKMVWLKPVAPDSADLSQHEIESLVDGLDKHVPVNIVNGLSAEISLENASEQPEYSDYTGEGVTQNHQAVLDLFHSALESIPDRGTTAGLFKASMDSKAAFNAGVNPHITQDMAENSRLGTLDNAEAFVFNFMAKVISATKQDLQEPKEDAPVKINAVGRATWKTGSVDEIRRNAAKFPKTAGDLIPVVGNAGMAKGENQNYLGNWSNITRPTVGDRTVMPIKFRQRRLDTFHDQMLGRTMAGQEAAQRFLHEVLYSKTGIDDKRNAQTSMDDLLRGNNPDTSRRVELNDAFMSDIGKLFSNNQLDEHLANTRSALMGLRMRMGEKTAEIALKKKVLSDLLETLKNPTKRFDEETKQNEAVRLSELADSFKDSLHDWVNDFKKNDSVIRKTARLIARSLHKFKDAEIIGAYNDYAEFAKTASEEDFTDRSDERTITSEEESVHSNFVAESDAFVDQFNSKFNKQLGAFIKRLYPKAAFESGHKFIEIEKDASFEEIHSKMYDLTMDTKAPERIANVLMTKLLDYQDTGRISKLTQGIRKLVGKATGVEDLHATPRPDSESILPDGMKAARDQTSSPLVRQLLDDITANLKWSNKEEMHAEIDRIFSNLQTIGELTPNSNLENADNILSKPTEISSHPFETDSILGFLASLTPNNADVANRNGNDIQSWINIAKRDVAVGEAELLKMEKAELNFSNPGRTEVGFDATAKLPKNTTFDVADNANELKVPLILHSESKDQASAEEFHVRVAAIKSAMQDFFDHGADDAFRILKGGDEQFQNYDVEKLMDSVVNAIQVQQSVVSSRWKTFTDAGGNVLSAEGIANVMSKGELDLAVIKREQDNAPRISELQTAVDELKRRIARPSIGKNSIANKKGLEKQLADHQSEISKLQDTSDLGRVNESKKQRVSRITSVANYGDRIDHVGRVINDGASKMLFVPVSAKADLEAHFKGQNMIVPLDPLLRNIVLNASVAPIAEDTPTRKAYGLGYTDAEIKTAWHNPNDFAGIQEWQTLHPGETPTYENIATHYYNKVHKQVIDAINQQGVDIATGASKGKLIDLTSDSNHWLNAVSKGNGELFEKILHSYRIGENGITISKETRNKINKLLNEIDNGSLINGKQDMLENMKNMRLLDLYGDVFADIEGKRTMLRLISGVNGNISKMQLWMLEHFHSQDSRTRHRFLKDYGSYQEAVRIQGYLETGFATGSGRAGHLTMFKKGQEDLEHASKGLHTWMDQSTGSLIASLEGTLSARGAYSHENLFQWYSVMKEGVEELQKFVSAQEEKFGKNMDQTKRNSILKTVDKFFNAKHVNTTEDLDGVIALYEIVKKNWDASLDIKLEEGVGESTDSRDIVEGKIKTSIDTIARIKEALLSSEHVTHRAGVENYSKKLGVMFQDISNAAALNNVFSSHAETLEEINARESLTDKERVGMYSKNIDSHFRQYSTLPLQIGRAENPLLDKLKLGTGERVSDPMHSTNTHEFSLSSKGLRTEHDSDGVFRPINLNGLSAPESIMRDASYRINVGPNYRILRDLIGLEGKTSTGMQTTTGRPKLLDKLEASEDSKAQRENEYPWKVVLATLAHEVENNINNDKAIGTYNTHFSKVLQHLSTSFTFRALASLQMIPQQTIPSIIGVLAKKLITGQTDDAVVFLQLLTKTGFGAITGHLGDITPDSDAARSTWASQANAIANLVKNTSPMVNFRGSEGMDTWKDLKRNQIAFNKGKIKTYGKLVVSKYSEYQEAGMEFVIAKWERPIARAIYTMELMKEMQKAEVRGEMSNAPRNLEELLRMDTTNIPPIAIQHAQIKVSDHMGQADQSKKPMLFQSQSQNPMWSALARTLVRFSTHTATTATNLAALQGAIRFGNREVARNRDGSVIMGKDNKPVILKYDSDMRREAVENFTGTMVQNVLFQFMKAQVVIPLAVAAAGVLAGKNQDDAIREGQELADSIMVADNEDSWGAKLRKRILFGAARPLFNPSKGDRESQYSALGELGSKTILEMGQGIPILGALMGYAPIVDMARPIVQSGTTEALSTVSSILGDKIAPGVSGISIPKYQESALGLMTGVTAPSSLLYDMMITGNKIYNSSMGTEATRSDVILYALSEILGTRELRMGMDKELTQHIRDATLQGE